MEKMKLNIQKFGQNTTFSESNIDVSRNTSSLTINISFWAPTSQTWFNGKTLTCSCDGQTQSTSVSLARGGSVNVSFTFHNIAHNNDGTKSVNWAWSCATGTSGLGTISNSGTQTLTTIARASQPSINTWPNNSPDFNIGDTITIHMNRKSTSFTHNVKLTFGSYNYTIGTNVTDNIQLNTSTIADNLYAQIPNNNIGYGYITVDTYNGSTYVGSANCSFNAHVVDANPTFSNFTFADTNTKTVALTGNNQHCIQGYSNIKGIISVANKAIAQKKAAMSKYRFTIGTQSVDINYSSTAEVSGTLNSVPSGTFNMYAIDSRNNSTLVTKLATKVVQYTKPVINASTITATRDSGGVGTNCTLKFGGTFWNSNFGKKANSIKIKYQLKKTTESTWVDGTTTITPTINGNNFSFQGLIARSKDDPFWEISESYNIKVIVTDELDTSFTETILINAVPNLALSQNGVGIMGKYEDSVGGLVQVGGYQLVESGNGYIKYYDGTMICFENVKFKNLNVSTDYWNFVNRTDDLECTFKKEFISKPVVILNNYSEISGDISIHKLSSATTKTTGKFNILVSKSSTIARDFEVQYIAIGKWK